MKDLEAEGRILSKKNIDRIKGAIDMHKNAIAAHTQALADMEQMLADCSPKPKEAGKVSLADGKLLVSEE